MVGARINCRGGEERNTFIFFLSVFLVMENCGFFLVLFSFLWKYWKEYRRVQKYRTLYFFRFQIRICYEKRPKDILPDDFFSLRSG